MRILAVCIACLAATVLTAVGALWIVTFARSSKPLPLAIVVAGDTAGWITPCGCTSNQSGGLARRATYVTQLRQTHDVLLVDAGGAPAGDSKYDRIKFDAILAGEKQMGVRAHNVGAAEAKLGADRLRELAEKTGVTFLSANARSAAGVLLGEPVVISRAGGKRVAFVGVLSPTFAADGVRVDDPASAILAAAKANRGSFDRLVVLAYAPEEELRGLAERIPEADAVVGGPTGQAIAPRQAGRALYAAATNKGKFLVELREPDVSQEGLTGQVVEMSTQFDDDPGQQANVGRFRDRLAKLDLPAWETSFLDAPVDSYPADFRVAGSDACAKCHTGDCSVWEDSGHAHAWQSLKAYHGAHVDAYCQQCHTTGYGLPDGFVSLSRSRERVSVGCESCHGPSATHAADPRKPTPYAAADRCVTCHDRENSPEFAYDVYWELIAHGEPASPPKSPQPVKEH